MSLGTRIRALENQFGEVCTECGGGSSKRAPIFIDEGEGIEQQYCPQCGRPLYTIICVVYEGEGDRR